MYPPRNANRHRAGCLAVSSLVIAPALVSAQSLASRMDAHIRSRAQSGYFSGAVLVSRGEEILLRDGYGQADLERMVPNRAETTFRIGSLTKPFTAAAVLRLVDDGILALDNRLCPFLTRCPAPWSEVTIRMLLSHSSGIPDLFGDVPDAPVEETRDAVDDAIEVVLSTDGGSRAELLSPPGTEYRYSNFDYVLLGYVIEGASGKSWEQYLAQHIFRPAGLTHTEYDDVWQIVPGRAVGYRKRNDRLANIAYSDHAAYAAGGLRSTVDDLRRFHRAFVSNELLSSRLTDVARTPGLGEYGFGWQITRAFEHRYENHNGLISGFASQVGYYPDEDLLIVVLANRVWDDNARTLACDLAAMYFEDAEHLAIDPRAVNLPAEPGLQRFDGVYDTGGAGNREVSSEDGRVIWRSNGGQFELIPVAPATFFPRGQPSIIVRFSETEDGGATFTARRCGSEFLTGTRR